MSEFPDIINGLYARHIDPRDSDGRIIIRGDMSNLWSPPVESPAERLADPLVARAIAEVLEGLNNRPGNQFIEAC